MTTINYLTYDFSNYNDVFQILDYKQLLPLSHLVDYDMLFNEYDSNIGTPTDLINYLNKIDPSILTDICSFLNSIPNNIQIKQSSAINWQCPGAVTVINGKQKNIKLLGEINQINNKVKVLFLIARAYCHQNYCGQLVFNHYDLWDKYWGPSSHSLFPEQVDCSKIDITSGYDTINIVDNNTYTYGFEHDYLIKIVRTDLKHKYFKSTNYIILKQKEQIKLTSLINGIYEISIAVSYTNGINGINDYVWSEFCISSGTHKIKLQTPKYLIIDNEVYWEYHFVLPADSNGNEGLPKYFDKYHGKMRNYFLTWWKETADGKLDNGSDTLGGASLENCSYDLRYTTEKPKKDSIWVYYNNISFKNKSNYMDPLPIPGDDPPFQDLNESDYQKITVLAYQNIWVQMRVRNQIGVPDWPITDGYPDGNLIGYNEFGDKLYGYQLEINTPPYFENVLVTDSNCEYPYTIGTFSWGAPADTMSPVQTLSSTSQTFKFDISFSLPKLWWAINSIDNTSVYQNNFKPDIKPFFLIMWSTNDKITLSSIQAIKFIFTDINYNIFQLPNHEGSGNNILPMASSYNLMCGIPPYIPTYIYNIYKTNMVSFYSLTDAECTFSDIGKVSINVNPYDGSIPFKFFFVGVKVLNLEDIRITNHRYPYNSIISSAISLPPFQSLSSPIGNLYNYDVPYSPVSKIEIYTGEDIDCNILYNYSDSNIDYQFDSNFSDYNFNIIITLNNTTNIEPYKDLFYYTYSIILWDVDSNGDIATTGGQTIKTITSITSLTTSSITYLYPNPSLIEDINNKIYDVFLQQMIIGVKCFKNINKHLYINYKKRFEDMIVFASPTNWSFIFNNGNTLPIGPLAPSYSITWTLNISDIYILQKYNFNLNDITKTKFIITYRQIPGIMWQVNITNITSTISGPSPVNINFSGVIIPPPGAPPVGGGFSPTMYIGFDLELTAPSNSPTINYYPSSYHYQSNVQSYQIYP